MLRRPSQVLQCGVQPAAMSSVMSYGQSSPALNAPNFVAQAPGTVTPATPPLKPRVGAWLFS
jgi:hypothetical protein